MFLLSAAWLYNTGLSQHTLECSLKVTSCVWFHLGSSLFFRGSCPIVHPGRRLVGGGPAPGDPAALEDLASTEQSLYGYIYLFIYIYLHLYIFIYIYILGLSVKLVINGVNAIQF